MKDNWRSHSLTLLSQDASFLKKYVHNFFKNEAYNNAAELLVEFEDAKFIVEHYLENENVNILFYQLAICNRSEQ